jgi:hypothetical protein
MSRRRAGPSGLDPESIRRCFAPRYETARLNFLGAARAAGLAVQSHAHPLAGRDGEPLALDVVVDGPPDASRLLIVSSGCHGVEGFCGSGVQVALLRDESWRRPARAAGVAVLYLHALNPHGFSWGRRSTHENVDLNRNFVDFSQPLPANPAYAELAPLLLPQHWPPGWRNRLAVLGFVLHRGLRRAQAAVTSGQHTHADGLFYGGVAPTWSQRTLRQVLKEHGQRASRLAWIDLHSGLGPRGRGERILACQGEAATARARAWWGPGVTSTDLGDSTSTALTGKMFAVAAEECPQAEYTGIALEFGTVSRMKVLDALRGDQWLENHPQARDTALGAQVRQRMREAFFIDTDDWKQAVVATSFEVVGEAVLGLANQGR